MVVRHHQHSKKVKDMLSRHQNVKFSFMIENQSGEQIELHTTFIWNSFHFFFNTVHF